MSVRSRARQRRGSRNDSQAWRVDNVAQRDARGAIACHMGRARAHQKLAAAPVNSNWKPAARTNLWGQIKLRICDVAPAIELGRCEPLDGRPGARRKAPGVGRAKGEILKDSVRANETFFINLQVGAPRAQARARATPGRLVAPNGALPHPARRPDSAPFPRPELPPPAPARFLFVGRARNKLTG